MIAKENNNFVITCDCGAEMLHIYHDEEYEFYEFAMYRNRGMPSFWSKLRMVWKIFKYGHPYTDDAIFGKEKINTLANWINEKNKNS